jgi:hypothetical protein
MRGWLEEERSGTNVNWSQVLLGNCLGDGEPYNGSEVEVNRNPVIFWVMART